MTNCCPAQGDLGRPETYRKPLEPVYHEPVEGRRRGGARQILREFIVNATIIGNHRQNMVKAEHDCNVPWAILMDPTSACNLNCTGCWAAEYGDKLNMSYEELDSVIRQGKQLGIFLYLYSGGEPLVRKRDLIQLCEAHPDCVFLSFTNGTLIDEAFADEMLRVQNFIPAISIEGFEEATDARRGKGTYQKVVEAMRILRERKLLFGASCCYTSHNAEVIGSEAYIDDLIEKGCKFAWLFTYNTRGRWRAHRPDRNCRTA
jgi:MoaA/NifB/PqqE/SkfB family radical SAM enzyme